MASPPKDFVAAGDPDTTWSTGLAARWPLEPVDRRRPRFAPADFTEGERLHERYRWPLDYEDLAPFYARGRAPARRHAAPPTTFPMLPAGACATRARCPRLARDRGRGQPARPGPHGAAARRRAELAARPAGHRLQQLLGHRPAVAGARRRFELRTGAHALRLEWSGRGAGSRPCSTSTGPPAPTSGASCDGVVVACGALRSTKLLFDSACPDFPDGIGNTDGLLGRYLHDHPKEWWSFDIDGPLTRLSPAAYLTRRPYDSSAPLLATSWTLGLASTATSCCRSHR